MTTIAFKGRVMAADSGSWAGDASHAWARKLAVGPRGTLYGVCGNADECCGFLDWVHDGEQGDMPKPRALPDGGSSFLVLRASCLDGVHGGVVDVITAYGAEEYEAPYYAIGSGSQAAFAAMYVGASAKKAIKAAKAHASGTFGKVQTIEFPKP